MYGWDGGLREGEQRGLGRRSAWANIIKAGKEIDKMGLQFSGSFGKQVGVGSDIRFWEDHWVGNGSLKERFKRLFHLEMGKRALVSERGEHIGEDWVWKWSWRRGREIGELEELQNVIAGQAPKGDVKDRASWGLDPQGGYTVKSLRDILEENRTLVDSNAVVTKWLMSIPKKICIFVWRAKLGRIPSRSVLDKMGIDLDSLLCPRCGKEVESIDHALVKCEDVKNLWSLMGRWWNIDVESASTIQEILEIGNQLGDNTKGLRRWTAMAWSTLYLVWANRNKMVFDKVSGSLVDRFLEFQLKSFE